MIPAGIQESEVTPVAEASAPEIGADVSLKNVQCV